MPLKLVAPTIKIIPLLEIDPSGETTVTFKQATMQQVEQRNGLFAEREYSWQDRDAGSVVTQKTKWNPDEVARTEVWLTMSACDIHAEECKCKSCGGEAADAKLLFPYRDGAGLGKSVFDTAWKRLPADWAAAILEACYEVNPSWGGRPKKGEAESA